MDYVIREILKKEKRSTAVIIALGFGAVIILNILITMTNNLGDVQNAVCIMLLFVFSIILFSIFEKIFFVYVYLLGDDFVAFEKHIGKKNQTICTIYFNQIKKIEKCSLMQANSNIQSTYYFIYKHVDPDSYYCEYEINKKLHRFIFKPSERLIRILEKKIHKGE